MKKYLGYGSLLLFIALIIFRIYSDIVMERDLTGHLKRAADANSIELALSELNTSINYIEKNNLTKGYTSIIVKMPDEDLGFWYANLKASQSELEKTINSSSLEKTNVLLKLRETLLDEGEKGSNTTYPEGISIFPNNKIIALLFLISLMFFPLLLIKLVKFNKEALRRKTESQKKKMAADNI